MAIEFACPTCGSTLQVGDDSAGRVIRCGACMSALTVPSAGARPAPPFGPYEVDRPTSPSPPPRTRDNPPAAEPVEPRRRDPDDRPRRRLPPEPPPTPGRGVFFWLVVIGAVMLLGTAVCCGGFFLLLPGAEWRKHESKDGGFRIDLPGRPQQNMAKAAGINLKDPKTDKDAKSEGAVLPKRWGAQFLVIYRDLQSTEKERLEKKVPETDEQVIESEFKQLLKAAQSPQQNEKPLAGEPSPLAGFEGREFKFLGRNNVFYTARVIVADRRVYFVLAGGGLTEWDDEDVQRFLRSFEITNKELLDAGQRRTDAKKKADADKKADAEKKVDAEREAKEAEAAERRADERRVKEILRVWAEGFGGAAVEAGLEAARLARPPLPLAPPPRPVVVVD